MVALLSSGPEIYTTNRDSTPAESGIQFADDDPVYAKFSKHPKRNGLCERDEGHTIARSSAANL